MLTVGWGGLKFQPYQEYIYDQIVHKCFLDKDAMMRNIREAAGRRGHIKTKDDGRMLRRLVARYLLSLKRMVMKPGERLDDVSMYDVMVRRREYEGLPVGNNIDADK